MTDPHPLTGSPRLAKMLPAKPRPLWITGDIIEHGMGRFVAAAEWQVTNEGTQHERRRWIYTFDPIESDQT